MINFFRQLGGAFGVNLLSVSLDRDTFFYSEALTSTQTRATQHHRTAERDGRLLAQAGASPDLQSAGALNFLGRMVYAQAYTLAFRDCFLIVTLVFLLCIDPGVDHGDQENTTKQPAIAWRLSTFVYLPISEFSPRIRRVAIEMRVAVHEDVGDDRLVWPEHAFARGALPRPAPRHGRNK